MTTACAAMAAKHKHAHKAAEVPEAFSAHGDTSKTATADTLSSLQLSAKPAVDIEGWHLELRVKKLQYTSFEEQRLVITKDVLALGPPDGGDVFDDIIPLDEIHRIVDLSSPAQRGFAPPGVASDAWELEHSICNVGTSPHGHNIGRSYLLALEFPAAITVSQGQDEAPPHSRAVPVAGEATVLETQAAFLSCLQALVRECVVRKQPKTWAARFARSRLFVKRQFSSTPLQVSVALLLVSVSSRVCACVSIPNLTPE